MSTKHDFLDGNGPVPAHRHKNPDGTDGGWVADTARVSGNAQVSGNARVYGNAQEHPMTRDVDAGAVPNLDTLVDKFADEYQHRPMYACKDMLRDFAVAVEAALRSSQPQAVKVPSVAGWYWARWNGGRMAPVEVRSYMAAVGTHLLGQPFGQECVYEFKSFSDWVGPVSWHGPLSAPTAAPQAPEGT